MKTKKFPAYIIVIAHKHLKEYKAISDILTDYFKEFPHILTTLNDGKEYYILPNSEIIRGILNRIYNTLDILDIDSFRCEIYTYDNVNPRIWDTYLIAPDSYYFNDYVLPECVPIFEPNDVKKLQYFLED